MRPIDADALDKILADAEIEARHNKRYVLQGAINTIRGNVAKMPTIEEQKTGKWIRIKKHHYGTHHDFDYYTICCSACGDRPEKAWHLTAYCPNCGSRMLEEGGEDDE